MCIRDRMREITIDSALNEPDSLPKPIQKDIFAEALSQNVFNDEDKAIYEEKQNDKSVSYTHLDVYKRQTLAHGGVLYMDEFPEFSRAVMETLRQPLEDRKIVVSRANGTYSFPADFVLMASMNPCRCGYYPDRNKCNCTENDVKKYLEKVSGPILDRMDLCVHMNPVSFMEIKSDKEQESSEEIRKQMCIRDSS